MTYLKRDIENLIDKYLLPNKVLMIFGPRRSGKTMLIKNFIKSLNDDFLFLNGETSGVDESLSIKSVANYLGILGNKSILIIDEAQKIPDIGSILKYMVDSIEGIKIIVTGSSSFDMLNKTGEPLTGRMNQFQLLPFSEKEFNQIENSIQKKENLQRRLIFGSYPELSSIPGSDEKVEYITQLVNSNLLKDILAIENIKNSAKIMSMLRLIAFQTGSLVSYSEIATKINMSKNTVEKYLDLLAKVFILFKVEGFSRNLRKEITKNHKWYFYDNGILNYFLGNFNSIGMRDDMGKLWENYILSERLKFQKNSRMLVYNYFWRTYDNQEIDLIEDRGARLHAYEFKWKDDRAKVPSSWKNAYPNSEFTVINNSNFMSFLS